MRIFVALDIEDAIRQRLQNFMDGVRRFAPDARWVRPEALHVTLKFIGEKRQETVEEIKNVISTAQGQPLDITFRGYGFFPTAKSPPVFWAGIECGPELAKLAKTIEETTSAIGIPKEEHPFSPHLTLARAAGRSGAPSRRPGDRPNTSFLRLQQRLATMPGPEFGTMSAREFFLYQSQLSRGGSHYTKIARFALK